MYKKQLVLLLCLSLLIFSCKRKKEDILANTWYATALDNPQMDAIIKQQQIFIDTIGTHTDAATNMQQYGIANADSMRKALQIQLDSFKLMQAQSVQNTIFEFRKDGMAILNFGGHTDSTKWYFDKDGVLTLDETKLKGTGDKVKMDVLDLNDTLLRLRFHENDMISTVSFKPGKK